MLTDNANVPLILVVEDDNDHAGLIKISLSDAEEEYRLEIADTLRAACSSIQRCAPDLVLTDYRLPDGEGSELVKILNGLCPVILLTSQGNEKLAVEAMKAGVQDYVVKSSAVFSGISRIAMRGLREWALIKEQKHAEAERQRMERHFLHIQKLESLGTMSGGIAHDFNNLLQVVLGNLELTLMKLQEDAPVRKYICKAVNAAERAAKLSGMMLAYSGRGLFNIKELSLTRLIEKNVDMLSSAISNSISFDLKLDQTTPQIMADDDQIQQVIMNLVINASEAIGNVNGTITLSTGVQDFDQNTLNANRLEEKLAAGRYVCMKVGDSGCGMDSDTLDKLFDPFFTTKFTGRGLGMSAVLGILRAHNGTILVESRSGVGTTIMVLFPIAANLQTVETIIATEAEDVALTASRNFGKVLIVDDEEIIRGVCIEMIREIGFDTVSASDGNEALRIIREQGDQISLALLDYSMPGMDGVAVFTELRKINPDIPVLLASGYSEEEIADRLKGMCLYGFIQKPFNLNRLAEEVKRLMMKEG